MLSHHYGFTHPIRPAPSRFLLKLFNGPMTIEEFRKGHYSNDNTYILNQNLFFFDSDVLILSHLTLKDIFEEFAKME